MNKVYTIEEIKNISKPIFEKNCIYKAILFGSYARGEARSNSDIDIVIDSKGELLNIQFYGVLEELTEKLKKKVDLFEVSEIKKDSTIYFAIKEDGIIIYER